MKLSDWKKVKLSELGTIVGGGTPSTKKEEYYGGNIPWITPKDLANFGERYIEHGNRNITLAGLENSSAKILPAGSILFSSRAPIGYIAITANNVTTNQGFKSIIPNSDVDSLFLYYLLKFNKDKIENMGSGTTFKEVSANVMKSIEVFIPTEIAEQRKISAILGAIDDKIENNKKINHHLVA
ncbi:restriction endonuclease subunit S [Streptococcus constellatus]|uniref:restriction endonuclease subunit S n=1 Tax=Streptococcus constellatus TaxID=76860 RepID=UPI0020011D42|nr:restriction endonuclease subunit S [Streptococcus constellatus]